MRSMLTTLLLLLGVGFVEGGCQVREWSGWSKCGVPSRGLQQRTRSLVDETHADCSPLPNRSQIIACNDCTVSEWTAWSSCEHDAQKRTRSVVLAASEYGAPCPPLEERHYSFCHNGLDPLSSNHNLHMLNHLDGVPPQRWKLVVDVAADAPTSTSEFWEGSPVLCGQWGNIGASHVVAVHMGSITDYFRPRGDMTLCDLLLSPGTFEWSSQLPADFQYTPTSAELSKFVTPEYNNMSHKGGSATGWPATRDPSEIRQALSFWGAATGSSELTGGCCATSKQQQVGQGWGQRYSMWISQVGNFTAPPDCECLPEGVHTVQPAGQSDLLSVYCDGEGWTRVAHWGEGQELNFSASPELSSDPLSEGFHRGFGAVLGSEVRIGSARGLMGDGEPHTLQQVLSSGPVQCVEDVGVVYVHGNDCSGLNQESCLLGVASSLDGDFFKSASTCYGRCDHNVTGNASCPGPVTVHNHHPSVRLDQGIWVRHRRQQVCPGRYIPRAGFGGYDSIAPGGIHKWSMEAGERRAAQGPAHFTHQHPIFKTVLPISRMAGELMEPTEFPERFCNSDGSDYRGTKNVTRLGRECVSWALAGLEQSGYHSNYCRNLDGQPAPWCFFHVDREDGQYQWEFCNVGSPYNCDANQPRGAGMYASNAFCSQGHFWNESGNECQKCWPGYFSRGRPWNRADECAACPVGRVTVARVSVCWLSPWVRCTQGGTVCDACSPGKHASRRAQSGCVDCVPGKFSPKPGLQDCIPCSAGYVTNQTGQAICELCPQGYYQSEQGQTACIRCPLGRVSEVEGSTVCTSCDNQTSSANLREFSNRARNRCVRCDPMEWKTNTSLCPTRHL